MLEEIIDVFKYLMCVCNLYGFSPEEFVSAFYVKSDIVDKRWKSEQTEWSKGAGILCVDIDGVLADYVDGYIDFLIRKGVVGVEVKNIPLSTYNIAEGLSIDKGLEEMAKREFQENGGFSSLPVYPQSASVLKSAREQGYRIALISARPYLEVRRIHADTVKWLGDNNVPYDAIFWGKDKADIVYSKLYPIKPKYFIEDRDKHAIELANEGIKVLLLDKEYNQGVIHPNIVRVKDWQEIYAIIK
jgi:hypothetical protein